MAAPGFLVGATRSGDGKTMVSCAIMAALSVRGLVVQPFKVGPDYIDPGFHLMASGKNCYNLDLWMSDRQGISRVFEAAGRGADLSVVEGVMGLFDSSAGDVDTSSAAVADILGLPVVLIVDGSKVGQSVAAMARGFADYRPDTHVAGVILNRVGSEKHEDMLRQAMINAGLAVLGCVPKEPMLTIPEKQLGLQPVNTSSWPEREALAAMGERYIDIDSLVGLASAGAWPLSALPADPSGRDSVRIGVLRDEAFCFYYQETFDALRRAGAELVFFSPISEVKLPSDIGGLVMGGGFPERFASELQGNAGLRTAIRNAVDSGMPVYAECGGLLYLMETLEVDGRRYEMTGILKGRGVLRDKRQALGYVTATVTGDCLIAKAQTEVRGHEFHWSDCTLDYGRDPAFSRVMNSTGADTGPAGYSSGNIMASYVHLQLGQIEGACDRMVSACSSYLSGGRSR